MRRYRASSAKQNGHQELIDLISLSKQSLRNKAVLQFYGRLSAVRNIANVLETCILQVPCLYSSVYTFTMVIPYEKERLVAELAVQRAVLLTKAVLSAVDKGTLSKCDDTPVTLADFGAQALIISAIHHNFPEDMIVGEESAAVVRKNPRLQEQLWELVSSTHLDDMESDELLSTPESPKEMLDAIDLGCASNGQGRVWVLDPVDGTAAFMRGEQYVVCLALIEQGQQKVGVLGCPNLDAKMSKIHETRTDSEGNGFMLSAVRGQGAVIRPISRSTLQTPRRIERRNDVAEYSDLDFVEQMLSRRSSPDKHCAVAQRFGAQWPGTELYSTQMKYVALAVGACDVMLLIPRQVARKEFPWDHAGGTMIFEEVGGKVTDVNGKAIDFGAGRILQENCGIIAAPLGIHARILQVTKEVIEESGEGST